MNIMKEKLKPLRIFVFALILITNFSIPVFASENDVVVDNTSTSEQFQPISTTDTISAPLKKQSKSKSEQTNLVAMPNGVKIASTPDENGITVKLLITE